ncbi:hypothetical protein V8E54_010134 [Elaphomyces granulatus]
MTNSLNSASVDTETPEQQLPKTAEDRKAAAALSSLNANEISQSSNDASSNLPSAVDQEALGKAMSRLEIVAGCAAGTKGSIGPGQGGALKKETDNIKKKAVKIAAEDILLVVEELDLTKNKATELLKVHDGDVTKAIQAFISPAAAA